MLTSLPEFLALFFPRLPEITLQRIRLDVAVGQGPIALGYVEFRDGMRYTTQVGHPELGRYSDEKLPELHGTLDVLFERNAGCPETEYLYTVSLITDGDRHMFSLYPIPGGPDERETPVRV